VVNGPHTSSNSPWQATRPLRRALAVLASIGLAAAAVGGTPAFGRGSPAAHTAGRTDTTILREAISASGRYTVVVTLRARRGYSELVTLYLAGQRARTTRVYRSPGVQLTYVLKLGAGSLAIRAASHGPAVLMRVKLTRLGTTGTAAPTGGSGSSSSSGGSQPAPTTGGTSPPAGSTGSSGATGPTAPTPPAGGPPSFSQYQNLLWSDDFVADYNAGQTVPNPSDWSYDNWGGCGGGTQSTNTTTGANAKLTAQGLAITATSNGAGGYTAAQLDSGGRFSIPVGATVEASIAMPQGQGLCPAFWMLSDQDAAGTTFPGEIDVVEAPSFTGSHYGQFPGNPEFVVHGPQGSQDNQLWITQGNPKPWSPGQFNTYGVVWTGSSITWFVNDVAYATLTAKDLPAGATWSSFVGSFHLMLDLAVGGWPGSSSVSSATMLVQWVKVFN
jgi:beta-glucanase (GH16 family)